VTLLTLTGFVAVFTYVAPLLSTVAGFSPGWVSVALVGYGLGTVAGNVLAGRVAPAAVPRVLPVPLAVLAVVLSAQPVLLRIPATAPRRAGRARRRHLRGGPAAADVAHGAGRAGGGRARGRGQHLGGRVAGALGAGLGGAVLAVGLGLVAIGPVAALPVLGALAAAFALRARPAGVLCQD
jgi:DHA1 family inner membrane transport protein